MWVRGLKLVVRHRPHQGFAVAPYVGAWIETKKTFNFCHNFKVAPYVGAWIETQHTKV